MRKTARFFIAIILTFTLLAIPQPTPAVAAGTADLTALGQIYLQDFNTLAVDGTSSLLPAGWAFIETGTTADALYTANRGNLAIFDTYSYGSTGSTDRALGSIQGDTLVPIFGAAFTNHAGGVITSVQIAYTGEQWRSGRTNRQDRLRFQLSTNATSLNTGTWLEIFDLDFFTVNNLAIGPKDGNSESYRRALSATISGLNIPQGSTFWIRWVDFNGVGDDDGLAVDDFSLIPLGVDDPPAVVSLTPADLATSVSVDTDLQITFSEPATLTDGWYGLFCTTSGALAGQVSGSGTSYTLNLDTPLGYNETCTFTVYASHVHDLDSSDPPDTPAENVTATFTTRLPPDLAPDVLNLSPSDLETGVWIDRNLMISFTEAVEPQPGWVTLVCDHSGEHDVSFSGADDVFTLDPLIDFDFDETCAVTIIAEKVHDLDTDDPPDTPAADYNFTFETVPQPDEPPSVVMAQPADADVDVAIDANLNFQFNEPVELSATWFDLVCSNSGRHIALGSGNNDIVTLDPEVDFAFSETCTLKIFAGGVRDVDLDDPPDEMLADAEIIFTTEDQPDAPPTVLSVSPTDASVDVAINSSINLNFNEPVSITTGSPSILCTESGLHSAAMSGGPSAFTLDPFDDFDYGESCTVSLTSTAVSDLDTDDPPDNLLAAFTTRFSTVADPCSLPYTSIPAIQGEGNGVAISGSVITQGVVVGDYEGSSPNLRGFYLQDETGDGNTLTSDGIFIFDSADQNRVSVGDMVRVTGTTAEYQGQSQVNLSAIHACGRGSVEPVAVSLPLPAPDFLERYEGMLVNFAQTLFVTDNYLLGRFGQVTLSANGRLFSPTALAEPGAPAGSIQTANFLNQIILDDAQNQQNPANILFGRGGSPLSAANTLRAGDSVSGLTGVLTYSWGGHSASPNTFRLRPVNLSSPVPNFVASNPRPESAPILPGINHVMTLNLLNYFNTFSGCHAGVGGVETDCRGAETEAEFERQSAKLVAAILAVDADVVAVTELENDGYGSESAIQTLVEHLNAATFTGRYAFVDADAATSQVNALGLDAIKVGLLYQSARVQPVGQTAVLNTLEFINGGDSVARNRASLLQAFENLAGARFVVNVNHLKSKSGACDLPDIGDGQGNCNLVRLNAVRALLTWLSTDPTSTGEHDILVTGDLNAYAREDPIRLFEDAGYVNLLQRFSATTPYSYSFNGQWGALDYALASPELLSEISGAATWAINADEPSVLDYNTNYKTAAQQDSLFNTNPFRSADHDPLIAGLTLDSVYPMVVAGAGTHPFDGQVLTTGIHQFTVQFNKDVIHDGGSDAANNPENYRLISAGNNGQIESIGCEAVGGDDTRLSIQQVDYDAMSYIATLSVNAGTPLQEGDYRLIVCGAHTIRDLAGSPLNQGKEVLISFSIRLPEPPQGGGEGEDTEATEPALAYLTRKPPLLIPVTGFAPGRITNLTPAALRFSNLGDLWLEVPALGLEMPIVGVPRVGDSWDVSWLSGQAGWLEGSAFPTVDGNSVLTSHVWDAANLPGPFYNIRYLGYDDKLIVHAWGEEYIYAVREVLSVKPSSVSTMLKHEERAWLTLVTCQGYNEDAGEYARRVLVRAVLVEVK